LQRIAKDYAEKEETQAQAETARIQISRIVQQCRKQKKQTGSRSLLNTGMGPWTLRNGHWVASIIARERQEQGSLKPGEIVRVYPDRRR
jgi:hypothetical protein